jgi:predicted dehydrogenase
MTDLLRVGFIGCGGFASTAIWPSLRYAPIEVAYACARHRENAERNRRLFGAERATTDVDSIVDDDSVAAVFVVGPPDMHHEIGLRVLNSGKHLFIDKPPGTTLGQALDLARSARRNGVQCQVGFQKRFALAYAQARAVAYRADFGGIRLCKVNYAHWRQPDWRSHLTTMSVHALDLVRFFLGDPREAYLLKRSATDGRNICVLTLGYAGGVSAVVNMSATDPHVQEWIELSGANQLISVRNLTDYRHWAPASDSSDSTRLNEAAVTMWHPEFSLPHQPSDSMWLQGYAGEVVAFAEAILAGRTVSPSIVDAVAAMRFVEAIAAAPEGFSPITLEVNDDDNH